MKTILTTIFLVLCLAGMGQIDEAAEKWLDFATTTVDTGYSRYQGFEFSNGYMSFSEKEYIELKALKLLNRLLSEYEAECWNDSTYVREPRWPDGVHIYNSGTDIDALQQMYWCEGKWIHKEPTFHGFMEFLKRKMCK